MSPPPTTTGKATRAILVGVLLLAIAAALDRPRVHRLDLIVDGTGEVRLSVDDEEELRFRPEASTDGIVELRTYLDPSLPMMRPRQAWRELRLIGARGDEILHLSGTEPADLRIVETHGAPVTRTRHGLRPAGSGRIVLPGLHTGALQLSVELVGGQDANIVVGRPGRTRDPSAEIRGEIAEGFAVVLRPRYHDLFWTDITGGELARAQDVVALGVPRPGDALPLLCRLAAGSFLVFGALGWLATLLPARLIARSRPLPLPSAIGPAALATGIAIALALLAFGGVPHVSDEISYLFQARIFAEGAWSAPLPPLPEFFEMEHVVTDRGGWQSKYPALWPGILSIGVLLGAPWVVNPLIGGAAILLMARWVREMDGRGTAWIAAALLATSPFFLILCASYFSQPLALLGALAFGYGIWRWSGEGAEPPHEAQWTRHGARLAGLALVGMAILRPLTAIALAATAFPWLLVHTARDDRARRVVAIAGIAALCAVVILGTNLLGTGDPLSSPYTAADPRDRPGFGQDVGSLWTWGSPGHDATKALANTRYYLRDLSGRLFGWPLGLSLCFVPLNFVLRRGGSRVDRYALLMCIGPVVAYFSYWAGNVLLLGPRYWFEIVPFLVLLSARGIVALATRLREAHGPAGRAAVASAVAGAMGFSLFHFLPGQAGPLETYSGVSPRLSRILEITEPTPSLVFVTIDHALSFHEAFANQDPWLEAPFVFARDLGARNAELIALFPERRLLRWNGATLAAFSPAVAPDPAMLGSTHQQP